MENMPAFNIADIVIVAVIALGAIRGFVRGLSGELSSVISTVVAVFAGVYLYRPLGNYVGEYTRMKGDMAYATAFGLAVIGGLIIMWIVRLVLRNLIAFTFRGKIERVGGTAAGIVRYGVLVAAMILAVALWEHPFWYKTIVTDSFIGSAAEKPLMNLYGSITSKYPSIPEDLKPENIRKSHPLHEFYGTPDHPSENP
ncbi:MAG: CvpA family protein [Verrucomicrobia bacterium]|nr:CvpA family protein [Verrucomicrobiota bacterium]